ncbi:hypothetical protein [Siphonobacter sp. SORGH_AS_1065]|uniref:hypothetical protein n=1 Tax=Siphonobacter sp. SORGH_AS_1065 TaxID=3041795 RepID=UPI00277F0CBD|nr:hypothetical protein [Siphonobacter sp. SORGH_AS_1065]MDQ1086033.1 SprT protein [Siphonobacter sp. SORGH_AS_1065]
MESLLRQHLPSLAVSYCLQLWQEHPFHFHVSRPRRTKFGDYSYCSSKGHRISVNGNMNAYAFLITYLHEVAHQRVCLQWGTRVAPHGRSWKKTFRELLKPVMTESIFPVDILAPLLDYSRDPKAATASHSPLYQALRRYDRHPEGTLRLSEVPENQIFLLGNRTFMKHQRRRTRFLCTDQQNGRQYTIPAEALVQLSDVRPE